MPLGDSSPAASPRNRLTERRGVTASSRHPRGVGSAIAVGKRIFLRRPAPQDRQEYLALRRRSASFLTPWQPRPSPKSAAARQFAAWLPSARSGQSEKLLLCSNEDGAVLASINLNEIVRGPAQSAYLGYWIGAPYAKRGYMTEALPLALRHGSRSSGCTAWRPTSCQRTGLRSLW